MTTSPTVNRRDLLKWSAGASLGALALWPPAQGVACSDVPGWKQRTLAYVQGLSRPDGGYAWEDQEQSHLTPTFAVIGTYRLLGELPPDSERLAEFVRSHHPAQWKKLEQEHREFEYQQIQSLLWLNADVSEFRALVSRWRQPVPYLPQYEQHRYPVLRFQLTAFICRQLLGMPTDDLTPAFVEYLDSRRRPNGSFNNTPADDGSDGHVLNTWWGLQALAVLNRQSEHKETLVPWLQRCQRGDDGFTWQPEPPFAGNTDVAYTWAAVKCLSLLNSTAEIRNGVIAAIQPLFNADGGCGNRPGWLSNPVATYYAIDTLNSLGALDAHPQHTPVVRRAVTLPQDLKVYSLQLEAHGTGSPAEAVDLARALQIHLWGAKNAKPSWLQRAQQLADEQQVPVTFFVANEEYGTWVDVPGLGTYSHTSDIMAPAQSQIGDSLAGSGVVSWPQFREQRLQPLTAAGGRLAWQFGENEELTRLFLDDSLSRGGYAAISTFHFGNPDFTNSEPFLMEYRGQHPYVALQDAHGGEAWWFSDMLTGFRTLFLAHEPTWEGWLAALQHNWVVAVRRDAITGQQLRMHGGSPEIEQFVRERAESWQWWDHPRITRPMVSLVAVPAGDPYELGSPREGITLRVRCAWENTPQGLPKDPLAELVSLTFNGTSVSPTLISTPGTGRMSGRAIDHRAEWSISNLTSGEHTATATVRVLATGRESSRTISFRIP